MVPGIPEGNLNGRIRGDALFPELLLPAFLWVRNSLRTEDYR